MTVAPNLISAETAVRAAPSTVTVSCFAFTSQLRGSPVAIGSAASSASVSVAPGASSMSGTVKAFSLAARDAMPACVSALPSSKEIAPFSSMPCGSADGSSGAQSVPPASTVTAPGSAPADAGTSVPRRTTVPPV